MPAQGKGRVLCKKTQVPGAAAQVLRPHTPHMLGSAPPYALHAKCCAPEGSFTVKENAWCLVLLRHAPRKQN